ncbi:MAG: adenylate/guanylate cyclase domain-containing protein [Acidimicrobiia bacterium]
MDRKLSRYLRKRGATPEEIEQAAAEHSLTLLALDRLLVPGQPYLDAEAVSERSGVPPEVAASLWRALGFPDAPDGELVFTDESVEAVRRITERLGGPLLAPAQDAGELAGQVRAAGAGLARVAEALSDQIAESVLATRESGLDDEAVAVLAIDALDWSQIAWLNDYALRVQVRAALRRKLLTPQLDPGQNPSIAVGFVDLVGYTAISQELDGSELAALVNRFEAVTYDTVARLGARLVKTIGDEVMFVTEDPEVGLRVALALTARTNQDDVLPRARAAVAFGPALAREGDYYGSVVNLAHRLVELARPSSAIVSAELAAALADRSELSFQRLRSRRIRGIGKVELFAAKATVAAVDPGSDAESSH